MELIDIYNEKREFTGRVLPRDTALKSGEYWLFAIVWVVNSRGELLITLRSREKKYWGGYWENTGGMVQSGEESRAGGARELMEETGIIAAPEELCFLASRRTKDAFHDIYAVKRDVSIGEISLQRGETDDARWVSVREFEKMCDTGLIAAPIIDGYKKIKPRLMEFIEKCKDTA